MSDASRFQQLSTSELEAMTSSSDETTFHMFLNQDPVVQRLKGERNRIEKDTLRLAQETMDLEPKFSSDRQRLIDSCQTYTQLRGDFDNLLESLTNILSGTPPPLHPMGCISCVFRRQSRGGAPTAEETVGAERGSVRGGDGQVPCGQVLRGPLPLGVHGEEEGFTHFQSQERTHV